MAPGKSRAMNFAFPFVHVSMNLLMCVRFSGSYLSSSDAPASFVAAGFFVSPAASVRAPAPRVTAKKTNEAIFARIDDHIIMPSMLARVLEPEVMDTAQEAADYDVMDNREPNERFASDCLQ